MVYPAGSSMRQDLAASISVHKLVKDKLASPEAAQSWKEKSRQAFPYSLHFQGEKRTAASVLDSLYNDAERKKTGQGKAQ